MTTPMNILEQMTYLFFMKMLNDKQRQEEANAAVWGNRLQNPVFPEGTWHNDDNDRMQAVISMPSGVFQPYAGVSTAILIFTKTNTPNSTDRVWFYEMHADGFTLDQKRTPCAENDIPDVINRFQHLDAETNRSRKEQLFFVPVEEIRANDYDLTFNKYKEVERKVVEYDAPETILARINDLQQQITDGLSSLQSLIK